MSEDTNTQPVVNPADAPPPAGSEAAGARTNGDDLDTLLSQYEQETRPPAQKPEPKPAAVPAPAAAPRESTFEKYVFRKDMDETIKAVRGDLPAEAFDDDLVESWIDTQARKDTRLQQAWLNRHDNPRAFEQVKTALGREFQKRMSKLPDRQVTEDREAVAAAVRGASNRAPPETPPNYAALNDADFQKAKEKAFGG